MKSCNQCGKCCTRYGGNGGLSASRDDIERWEAQRPDIFRWVSDGRIWVDPSTGEYSSDCPWLRKLPERNAYVCAIYEHRPEDCRQYPVLIDDMYRDGCDMLERSDLARPRRAQRRLDEIMADSRPALGRC